jgi:hypothetical protein
MVFQVRKIGQKIYSYFKEFAGLANEAFAVWTVTVASAINKAKKDESRNIQTWMPVR